MAKHEARYWESLEDDKIRCTLCNQYCTIVEGRRGLCGVRENQGGTLYTLVYNRPVAMAVDPIEKKPLFHFMPGTRAFSVATAGCNFTCRHCQNCDISSASQLQRHLEVPEVSPKQLVSMATDRNCNSIAYTYTEPTIFFEYAHDTAKLAHEAGLKNVFVTNGYITSEPLKGIAPVLDAANIDLKFFTDDAYREVCGAHLQPVLDAIRAYHDAGVWLELTTLVIPGYNDSERELSDIAGFIADVDPGIPWHVSRFFPAHKMDNVPPPDPAILRLAQRIGKNAGLEHVHAGNL